MAAGDLVVMTLWSGFIFTFCYLIHCFLKYRRKSAMIEMIPGPAKFSTLLGNIPLEIVKHVGGSFEESKDLYQSKFSERSIEFVLMLSKRRLDAGGAGVHQSL
jgi:hypothetical protein